jgi:hypothetical protein
MDFLALRASRRSPAELPRPPAPDTLNSPHCFRAKFTLRTLSLGPKPWSDIVTTQPPAPAHSRRSAITASISSKKPHTRSLIGTADGWW